MDKWPGHRAPASQTPKLPEDWEVGFVIRELSDAPGAPGMKVALIRKLVIHKKKKDGVVMDYI